MSETHTPKQTITEQHFTRHDINVNASKMLLQPCSISYNATTPNFGAQLITMATQHNMPSSSMQNQSNYHQRFNKEDLNQRRGSCSLQIFNAARHQRHIDAAPRQGIMSTLYKSDQMAQSHNTQSSYPTLIQL